MRCDPGGIARLLKPPLKPVWLVHGDEPLLVQESVDAIRAAGRAQGYTERDRYDVSRGDEWTLALASSDNLSLFAERKILEIHASGKPDASAAKELDAWLASPPEDILLVLVLPRLDSQAQKSRWFAQAEAVGVSVSCQPLAAEEHRRWLEARLTRQKLRLTPDALRWLSEQTEGNLLAAAQEVLKLGLLHDEGELHLEHVQAAAGDSARYTLFDLTDAALAGDAARAARILASLRAEGQAESLLLWTLSRETRLLASLAEGLAQGEPPAALFQGLGVWAKRQPLYQGALKRIPPPSLRAMGELVLDIDLAIKGQSRDNPWDLLLRLTLALAGVRLFENAV